MKKSTILVLLSLFIGSYISAQSITASDRKKLREKEDSLKEWAQYMITDTFPEDRMFSDSIFTRVLVRALQIKN